MLHPKLSAAALKKYTKKIAICHKALGISEHYATERGLAIQPEAKKLIFADMEPRGRDHFLTTPAAKAWLQLKKAAKRDKIKIILISGFRSVARQCFIIEEKIKKGETLESILARLAAPGYSEHHTGSALDLAHPDDPYLEERFEQSATFAWLTRRASEFGFVMTYPRNNAFKFIYEPWHWCYVAK